MRSLKALVGTAGLVMLSLACSISASADTICKANEAPCAKANAWAQETVFESELKAGTEFEFVGLRTWKCTASSRADRLFLNYVNGGKGQGAGLVPLGESFSGCTNSEFGVCAGATASGFPETFKWFANPSSPGDGYASPGVTGAMASLITFNCGWTKCKFKFSEQLVHAYEGGSPAIEVVKAKYTYAGESLIACGQEVEMRGEREIVSPSSNPVYWTLG